MTLFLATESRPYEGEEIKGVFTTLEAAKKAAIKDMDDYHTGIVYQVDVNQVLTDFKQREDKIVWKSK